MATKLDICNSALMRIGLNPISNLDDNLKEAKFCKMLYGQLVNSLLREPNCDWNFAKKRVIPALVSSEKLGAYEYYFSLPADCIRISAVYDLETVEAIETQDWEIFADRTVGSNFNIIQILYVSNNINDEFLDSKFTEVLSYRLALDLSLSVKNDGRLAEAMRQQYERELMNAIVSNKVESPIKTIKDFNLLANSRL